METYEILRDLAIILLAAKFMAIVAKKVKAPAVVGEIIAGLIIGPCLLNLVVTSDFISKMAEIGVILIMFSAGLETNLKELKKSGLVAFLIACMGVLVPFVGGRYDSNYQCGIFKFSISVSPTSSYYDKVCGRLCYL